MATDTRKLIAVVGGTGTLGGSVARSLHDTDNFRPRVLSRDPTSEKAKELLDLGIEVVKADNWDADALQNAFKDCWGVFINIDSDLPNFKQKVGPGEPVMGKNIIDSAIKAGVKHAVHASLLPASELTNGKVSVLSFDDKAATSKYMFEQAGLETATVVSAGWFLENATDPKYTYAFGGFATTPDSEGYLTYRVPAMGNNPESVPWLAAKDDYGDFVHGVFLDPHKWDHQRIHGVSDSASFAEMTAKFQKVTGKPARHVEIPLGGLTASNPAKTREVNLLFECMQAVKGNFFDGVPTAPENARALKAAAAKNRRSSTARVEPMTVEDFFKTYFM